LKKHVNEYTLFNADKSSFENVFSTEDPWKLNGRQEQFRYKIVMKYIRKNFLNSVLRVLELGCAEGNFTEYLVKEEYKITAVDISERAIERAKKKNLPNTEFVCADMLDYIANHDISRFDVVLLMEVIYYFSKENKIILLEQLHKKMNPDAKLLVSSPVSKSDEMFIPEHRILKKFGHKGFGRYKDYDGIILSSRGISGKLLEFIPTCALKKFYLYLHKYILPFRINQKLFMFRRD
jgi:2-polyprenyl-3-methyl-5-hydroxy-6-metoxy-1,4-benzoquinol methylase